MITKYLIKTTLSLLALTLLSGSILMSSSTSAEDVVDEINITVPVSCSLSGTGMTSHTATIENGRYVSDIGATTLKAFCNDNNGFAIYANGYTGNTLGNNKLIGSSTSSEIVTGTATTAGSPDISNWAMKLETNSSATYALTLDNGFGSYSNVPSSYTKVAHRDSGTDLGTSAEGASLTTTYASYISKTQPADSYLGQVIYTLVHPASEEPLQPQPARPGKIVYHPNNSSVVGTMGDQDATNSAETTLWASNFKRTGYGFAGWNTAYDYSGTYYGPNQTITAPADVETNGLSLYAVWIKSAGSLQNWDGCSSLAQGATTALTDERDGNTYAVAKLADGKCWTIENLRLADKDSSNNDIELSNTNTHNPSLPLNNTWFYKNRQSTLTTSNHLSATSDPTSTDPDTAWCQTHSSNCDDQSMLATNNTTLFTNNTSSSYSAESNVYSYGNYYNWYSATAGHGKYGSSYEQGYEAPGDICPVGWHLPTGGSASAEFGALDVAMGGTGANQTTAEASNRWRTYPNNFVYSGRVYGSSVDRRGLYGRYWSSSAYNSDSAYSLSFYSSNVYPVTYSYKYYGKLVRCVSGV
ncbi:hypothetical protein IKF87_01110 [Candidatus Saccharibacteria bacterium]|nr:hypothetical protein [Candidatus Saccharibacteria bacterium]